MNKERFCDLCDFFGGYLPWGLLILGGLIGAVSAPEIVERASAYLIAFAFLLLIGSIVLMRALRAKHE